MKIPALYRKGKLPISYEIFPPKGELSMDALRTMADALAAERPDYISVTYAAGGSGNSDRTAVLTGMLQREYGLLAMAHLTCRNSTRADVDAAVQQFREQGVTHVLALRGDRVPGCETQDFQYASQLIEYLGRTTELTLGAACYPEGHVACSDPARDLDYLRQKQDAGAAFFITQLFFDNDCFFRFREKAAAHGITVPIDVGVMPILSRESLIKMSFNCGASIPAGVVRMVYKYQDDPESLRAAGIEYAARQICELAAGGVDGIHLYVMNKPDVAHTLTCALHDAGY